MVVTATALVRVNVIVITERDTSAHLHRLKKRKRKLIVIAGIIVGGPHVLKIFEILKHKSIFIVIKI